MALTAAQHFFDIPELVEQVLLDIEGSPDLDEVDSAVAHIKELQQLRRTSPFVNDLIQGSPKLRQKMNLERLPNDDLAYQATASIVSNQLLQMSNENNLWGYQLTDFDACQIEDDRTHVILYDIQIASSTPESPYSPQAAKSLLASWSQMLLAPSHMSTIVRILITTSTSSAPHEVTFFLPPNAAAQDLFATFDKLSSSAHQHRNRSQVPAPQQYERRPSLSQKRSREHLDEDFIPPTADSASWEDSLEVCSPARLIKRKKCLCAEHPGWESCIHLEGGDSSAAVARANDVQTSEMSVNKDEGMVIYAI